MTQFDLQATETIYKLTNEFNIKLEEKEPLISNIYTFGAEVEIKFRYFFPNLHNKYFLNKKYNQYSESEKQQITKEITKEEINLKPLLEKVTNLGIPKGNDIYHEFAFNPVNNLTLLYQQIETLKQLNLIPNGEHSFHITIGNINRTKNTYYILMILELLYLKQDRILSGFNYETYMNDTWAKKGRAGITIKKQNDLIDCNNAIELRTLMLYNDTNIYEMFQYLHYMLHNDCTDIYNNILNEFEKHNLPNKNWENIHRNHVIWNTYSEKFNELQQYTKELFNNMKIVC